MKPLLILISVVLSGSFASAACIGEAQIISVIKSVSAVENGKCKVHIEPNVRYFRESIICALDLETILQKGITDVEASTLCKAEAGDDLMGVLVQKEDGSIILEK